MTTAFWHPFANMAQVAAEPELVVTDGDGVWITDEDGRRYIDATAGLWYCNAGYGRSEIVDRVAAQMQDLPVVLLLRRLRESPGTRTVREDCGDLSSPGTQGLPHFRWVGRR